MSTRTRPLTDELYDYMLEVSLRETEVQRRLREETARHPEGSMQIAPEQGQFMALLARLVGARRALEVGVFTGYSALTVALALPEDGELVALDVSEEYTAVARRFWREAGVDGRINLRIGPALESLDKLIEEEQEETFDFAFIDADKAEYEDYYERALKLLRPGGLMVLDNTFRSGRVLDAEDHGPSVTVVDRLNRRMREDERIHLSFLPVADGLSLALKK